MVKTPSTMLEIGTQAPDFGLPEPLTGQLVNLSDYQDCPVLIVFSCNHCPYVLHIIRSFAEFSSDLQQRGIACIMINANDVEKYSDDSPQNMVRMAHQYNFEFPYLYDESQQIALAYQAACTPDFYLFNDTHQLVYRGQYDGSRPGNDVAVTGADLRAASEALINGDPIPEPQLPSVGCSIKWQAGNEPQYG